MFSGQYLHVKHIQFNVYAICQNMIFQQVIVDLMQDISVFTYAFLFVKDIYSDALDFMESEFC